MNSVASCPDRARLRAHLEGSLVGEAQDQLIAHLDRCEECRQALEELAAGDGELVALARTIGRETSPTTPELSNPALTEDEAAWRDVLEPARQPGELGRLGQYVVNAVLGRGGMGVVFRASDPALRRTVAIKVLAPERAVSIEARQRFVREARAAAAVRDDYVVAIHAVGEARERPYLVMEYVAGPTLQERLDQEGRLPVEEVLRIGAQAAAGLAAAHAQGLVHRDVKPANILTEAGGDRVKLTDFGLARAVDETALTQSGVVAGTPQYMAPEQGRAEPVDHRADLFALGSVLYSLCTGSPPFRGDNSLAVLKGVCEEEPTPAHVVNPAVPKWLSQVIGWLHVKEPAGRFPSAAKLAELLTQGQAHLHEPRWVPQSLRLRSGRRLRNRGAIATVMAAAAVLLMVILSVGLVQLIPKEHPSEPAVPIIRELRRFDGHKDAVRCVAFSPDGRWALSGSGRPGRADPAEEFTLRLWDVASGQQKYGFVTNERRPQAQEVVVAVAFSPDGAVAVAISEVSLWRWDLATKQPRPGFPVRPPGAFFGTAALSADSCRGLTSAKDDFLSLWDLETGQRLARLKAHDEAILSTAFTATGLALVAGGGRLDAKGILRQGTDFEVRLWDLTSEQEVRRYSHHTGFVWGLALSPHGRWLVTGAVGYGPLRVWDAETGVQRYLIERVAESVWAVIFCPDGRRFLSGAANGMIQMWDVETGRQLARFEGHEGSVHCLACSPDGRWLLSGGVDATVRLWPLPELK